MKNYKIIVVLLLSSFTFLYSCKEEASVAVEETNTLNEGTTNPTDFLNTISPSNSTNTTNAANPVQQGAEPAQNSAGVWHYTCTKGCTGGSGTAEPCKSCGTLLAHNQAYHSATTTTTTNNTPVTTPNPTPVTTTPKPEPAQNAAGVWHYTCSKGCAGGSGTPEPCKSCGTVLAHNQAYHQ